MTHRHHIRATTRWGVATALLLFALGPAPALDLPACAVDAPVCCEVPRTPPGAPLRLGVQLWPQDFRARSAAVLALRPSAIRYAAGPAWRRLPVTPVDAGDDALDRVVAAAFDADPAYAAQARDAAEVVARSGAEAHLVLWEPLRTTAEPPEGTAKGRTLAEEAVPVTARFLVAVLAEYRRRGFPADVVELVNEPDGDWNIRIPAERYVRLVEAVRTEAKRRQVALPRIAGPGTGRIGALDEYLRDPALARRLLAAVDLVSAHGWDDRTGRDIVAEARRVRDVLDRLGYRKPVALTEIALTLLTPGDKAAGAAANGRGDGVVSGTAAYGARSAQLLLALAANRFSPLILWEFRDQDWGKSSYGLFDLRDRPRPLREVIDTLAGPAHSPAGVAEVLPGRGYLFVADGRETALALVNPGTAPLDLRLAPGTPARSIASGQGTTRCDAPAPFAGVRVPQQGITVLAP